MRNTRRTILCLANVALVGAIVLNVMVGRARGAVMIRDVARLENDVPNELIGMGLVVGLNGTGDGGDFLPAMRPLMAMMKRFDDSVTSDKEMKNANNVAIVHLSMKIPPQGARSGDQFDIDVSALAAKSLRGGRLVIMPMFAPRTDMKMVLASAEGKLILDDPLTPTTATIHLGGTLIRDVLPREIVGGKFTLALHPNTANLETATAVADRINEEVAAQTDGLAVARAMDETSVEVVIPKVELGNVANFISRIRTLQLPNMVEPSKVIINRADKTIFFTDNVQIATTTVSQGSLTVTIGTPTGVVGAAGVTPGMATMKDLQDAFNLLKVSPDDRIHIVEGLHKLNALKAELEID